MRNRIYVFRVVLTGQLNFGIWEPPEKTSDKQQYAIREAATVGLHRESRTVNVLHLVSPHDGSQWTSLSGAANIYHVTTRVARHCAPLEGHVTLTRH